MKDLKGLKFNRWLVVSISHKSKNNGWMWKCLCDCGNESTVGQAQLTGNHSKSCGCLRKEICSENKTHGMSNTPIYQRWVAMKTRCNNKENPTYGGKNIEYCTSWSSFENFYKDMGDSFHPELELDRIDVTLGYSKENCRWVNHNENNFNKNIQINNQTGKTGVSFREDLGKYRAYITVNRKQISLGVFDSFQEAVTARESAEIQYYGYNRP